MNSQELGTKAAAIVDTAVVTTAKHVAITRDAISTFFFAFRTELQARRLSRRMPEVRELGGTVNPF